MSEVLCRRQPTQSLEGQRVATACPRGANEQIELEGAVCGSDLEYGGIVALLGLFLAG